MVQYRRYKRSRAIPTVGIKYEFNKPSVSPPSGNAAHITVTKAARKRPGAYSEVSAIKHGVAPPKPNPATTLKAISIGTDVASAVRMVKTPICAAATISSVLRPKRSASGPNVAAPTVAPTRVEEKIHLKLAIGMPSSSAVNGAATQRPIVDQLGDVDLGALPRRVGHGRLHNFACRSRTKAESPICRSRLRRSAARMARTSANASLLSRLTMT